MVSVTKQIVRADVATVPRTEQLSGRLATHNIPGHWWCVASSWLLLRQHQTLWVIPVLIGLFRKGRMTDQTPPTLLAAMQHYPQ